MKWYQKKQLQWLSLMLMFLSFGGCWCVEIYPPSKLPSEFSEGGFSKENYLEKSKEEISPDEKAIVPEEKIQEQDAQEKKEPEIIRICNEGDTLDCDTQKLGVCKQGKRVCLNNQWSNCESVQKPGPEICDLLDNNCDGKVDENLVNLCPYSGDASKVGKGICKQATSTCVAGKWSQCTGEVLPEIDICNAKDDDCDGLIDNKAGTGLPLDKVCYTGPAGTQNVGECRNGLQACINGQWSRCLGEIRPAITELCDGKDDDCDGQVDEDFTTKGTLCHNGLGECKRPGKWICKADGSGVECDAIPGKPQPEICDNLDNDCDGFIDNHKTGNATALSQSCYTGPNGTLGVGVCKSGVQTCNAGSWGSCQGEIKPTSEVCNDKDDDCNGVSDDYIPVQRVSSSTVVATQGESTHMYLEATPSGYAIAWSKSGNYVKAATLDVNGKKVKEWTVHNKQPQEFSANVHGFAWDGKRLIVTWDSSDSNNNLGDALMATFDAQGTKLSGPTTLAKGGYLVNPQIAVGKTFYGIIWSDFQNNTLTVGTYDTNFNKLGTLLTFPLSVTSSQYPGLAFSNDLLGLAFASSSNQLKFALIDKQNKQIGTTTTLTQTGNNPYDANTAGLADGFFVVWQDRTTSAIYLRKIDTNGKEVGTRTTITSSGGKTPIVKTTSTGGLVAWLQTQNGRTGVSVMHVDTKGQAITSPSWFHVQGIQDYLSLAWVDFGQGKGAGMLGWVDQNGQLLVAPLGCVP